MITIPAGVKIYLACGVTDMRRGFDGLSIMAQLSAPPTAPPSEQVEARAGRQWDRQPKLNGPFPGNIPP